MTYWRVNPVLWDDEDFFGLDDSTRVLWFALLCGPQVTALPGLQRGGIGAIAETLRRAPEGVAKSLHELMARGMVEFDERRRVLWVPNAPKHNPAESPNHIKAWWNRWREIPDCTIKFKHVDILRRFAGLETKSHKQAWDDTFGSLPEGLAEGFGSPGEDIPNSAAATASASAAATAPASRARARADAPPPETGPPRLPDAERPNATNGMDACVQLRSLSDGVLRTGATPQQAIAFGEAIDALRAQHRRDDLHDLLGAHAKAGGFAWMTKRAPTTAWLLDNDGANLSESIEHAIAWDNAGRGQVPRTQRARAGPGVAAVSENFDDDGPDPAAEMVRVRKERERSWAAKQAGVKT